MKKRKEIEEFSRISRSFVKLESTYFVKARVYLLCNMFLMVASILNAEEYNSTNYQKKFKEQTDFH